MTKLPKNRVPVSVGIPFDLLQEVDELANKENTSRSDFVVQALLEKVEREKKN